MQTRRAAEGPVKKRSETKRFPSVRQVKEKSVKPDPLVFMPGGETKIETSNRTHQMKVSMVKKTVT